MDSAGTHLPTSIRGVVPRVGWAFSGPHVGAVEQMPNKRLKLPGGDRSKGTGVFAPSRARTVVHYSCAGGRVARSLGAIR